MMRASAVLVLAGLCGGACGGSNASSGEGATAPKARRAGAQSCERIRKGGPAPATASAGTGSTIALADWSGRTLAFVADEDENAVHVVDVDTKRKLSSIELAGKPSQLLFASDGRLVVTIRDRAELAVLEPGATANQPLEQRCSVPTAAEPVALASSKGRLLVSSGWGRALAVFDETTMKETKRVSLAREPRAVVVSDDGKRAFVTHAVGAQASVVDLTTKEVRTVSLQGRHDHEIDAFRNDLRTKLKMAHKLGDSAKHQEIVAALHKMDQDVSKKEEFRNRRTSCQGFALAKSVEPDGRILAPQVLVDPGDPSRRTVGYGEEHVQTEMPSVAVIDQSTGYPMPDSLRINQAFVFDARRGGDQAAEHCILPRAAAVDPKTQSLLVSCFGSDMVVAYDALSPDPVAAEKRRWRVGAGPSGIAVDLDEKRAVVWSQFDRALNVIPLGGAELEAAEGDDDKRVVRVDLPANPKRQISVAAALGRSLFHATGDNRIARDGRACASCHPDGRDDGLVWATPNGARRTKMLAGMLAETAPYSWDGDAMQLRDHVTETFKRLNGVGGLRSLELRALMAYVQTLPMPPATIDAGDDEVQRGAELFASKSVGCADCHNGALYTDNKSHDVKSKTPNDRRGAFNTPSLRFLAGRAPYYHDGRYATLRELLDGTSGTMGHTKQLSNKDLGALEAFLKTL
jgi:DNA-binding beta-propeller fold protein YncE/mono/diheme cytochrome c family protein